MFDKLYKEANDSIPVNTELMERLKGEARKENKKRPYSFMYRYGFVAAAVVIVTVSLNVLPELIKGQKSTHITPMTVNESVSSHMVSPTQTPENFTDDKTDITPGVTPAETSEEKYLTDNTADIRTENSKKQSAKIAPAEKNKVTEQPVTVQTVVKTEVVNEIPEVAAQKEIVADKEVALTEAKAFEKPEESTTSVADMAEDGAEEPVAENYSNEKLKSSGGGGGGMMRSMDALITVDEYCNYFGFTPEKWVIPEGMTVVNNESFRIGIDPQTGNYDSQTYAMEYLKENERITVTMVPESDVLFDRINSGEGEKYGENCVVEKHSESLFSIYLVKNNLGYIIETENLEKENVYQLIDSIE